jgi:hypothetical protein
MAEKNPVEYLLGYIGELLKLIPQHQGPISQNVSPEILNELERLELAMAQFEELNKQTFKNADIDIENLKAETINSDKIVPKQKQLLKKSQEIQREAKQLQAQYAQVIEKSKVKSQASRERDPLKKEMKDRKKKYKPLGGDKNWIPI